jgi:glutamyl-tRNA synthetase
MYEALGYPVPEFAHVPMILGADKARLSKRHGATSVMAYREMGYLPEAMVNYLVRLGWSFGDQEIFSLDELIEKFSLENVGRSAGVFNPDKLLWLNAHYIKSGDPVRLGSLLDEYLAAKGINTEGGPALPAVVRTLAERARTMVEMADGAAFYFAHDISYDPEAAAKHLTADKKPVLEALLRGLEACPEFDEAAIEAVFTAVLAELGLKLGKVGPSVRVALTGGTVSPGIYEVMAVLGKEESLRRLAAALRFLPKTS